MKAVLFVIPVDADVGLVSSVTQRLDDQGMGLSGLIALSEGNLLSSVILSSTVIYILEREFLKVRGCCSLASCLWFSHCELN